jgi:glycosyltransferase involved in cell wall biosynthesis
MPNIIIVTAVYPPEPVVSARMSYDLAHALALRGNEVTVICPQPSRPSNADYSQYQNTRLPAVVSEDGIEIVRLPSFTSPESRMFSRLYESWSFGYHVCKYLASRETRSDAIYVNAWPLLAPAQISRHAKKNCIPLVLQIMDVYPESLLAKLPNLVQHLAFAPLLKLDAWIALEAHSVVVISENMKRTYIDSRRILATRVTAIPTWQDDTLFEIAPDRVVACLRYGIPKNNFTFLYLGNIGPVAGVDFIIRAFHKASLDGAQLVIAGDGSSKQDCVDLARQLGSNDVHFVSDHEATNVPLLQSMADVCLLPMKRGTGMSSIPSKLPAYMFSAKPVLATLDEHSDSAKVIRQASCGWIGGAEDLQWLSQKMKEVASLELTELQQYGRNGRNYAISKFSKAEGVTSLAELILSAASCA